MRDKYDIDISKLKKENILGKNMSLIRKREGFSQKKLAMELEYTGLKLTPGALSRWENGDSSPSAYQLLAFCRIFGISDIFGTLFGLGLMNGSSHALSSGAILNSEGEELLLKIRGLLADSGMYQIKPSGILLRVYNQSAAAGLGDFLDDESFEELEFLSTQIPKGTDFGVRISGDSMEPKYADGGIAMVKSMKKLGDGDIGIFIYNGDAFIKQYRETTPADEESDDYTDSDGILHKKIILHSINTVYQDIAVSPGSDFAIVGKVLN